MFIITDTFMTEDQTVSTDVLAVCFTSDEARTKLKELSQNIRGIFVSPDFFVYDEHNSMCINYNSSVSDEVYVLSFEYDTDSYESGIIGVYRNIEDAKAVLINDIHNTFDDAFNDDIADGNYDEGSDVVNTIGNLGSDGTYWYLEDEYNHFYTYNLYINKKHIQ